MLATERITFKDYRQIEAVNVSSLLELLKSPRHYRHRLGVQRADSDAFRLGRAFHTAVLEPMQFLRQYALSPFDSWRTKAARQWREDQEAEGKTVLTEDQYRLAERMRDAVLAHPRAMSYLRCGQSEVSLRWEHGPTGLKCKGRVDYLTDRAVIDLKSTRHSTPDEFFRTAARLNYHVRLAWYLTGAELATGQERTSVIVAVENQPPHDVAVYRLPADVITIGRRVADRLMGELKDCIDSGNWPGAVPGEVDFELPQWAAGTPTDTAPVLTMGGKTLEI